MGLGLAPSVQVNRPKMTMSTPSGLGTKEWLEANVSEGSNKKVMEGGGTTSSQVVGDVSISSAINNRMVNIGSTENHVQQSGADLGFQFKEGVRSSLAEGSYMKMGTRGSSPKKGRWKRRAINVGVKGKGHVEETQLEKKEWFLVLAWKLSFFC
ncbi:hypothetical protein QYF36_009640 [Acer negundo]|nr:hypothetical protein QYF36_009640 [Acer negundo]